jgi:hypothetical protein
MDYNSKKSCNRLWLFLGASDFCEWMALFINGYCCVFNLMFSIFSFTYSYKQEGQNWAY